MEQIGQFRHTEYTATLPPLVDGQEARHHRVILCGGGPVGMATALALARHGVPSVIVEADNSVCIGSRAACISRRSLEIIDQLGVLPAFLGKGLAWTGGRSYYRTEEVFQFEMPHDQDQKLPPMINLQQYYIEQFLYEAIQRQSALIEVRWASSITALEHDADGVSVQVSTAAGDYRMRGDWLVATDGGQSFVRNALGLRLRGTAYEGKYVIADIELDSDYPAERRAWFDPPSNPGSTMLMHRQPDNIWRIDYQVPDDVDPDEAIKEENVFPIVRKHLAMLGEHGDWKPVWLSLYRAGAMTLDSYCHGRVLFAGNAAHAVPIFGVRGLNSGFDDAWNLAWKLAFVVRGWSPATLLQSYSTERVQAFHENISYAAKSTEFMAPPSRGFALMREAALSLTERHAAFRSLLNPRQTTPITYEDSALSSFAAASAAFRCGPPPGASLLEYPVRGKAGDGYLTELLGSGFTALVFSERGEVAPELATVLQSLAAGEVPFQARIITREEAPLAADAAIDSTGRLFAAYDAQPGTLYLVRPDGHVAARWQQHAAPQLQAALQQALAHTEGASA